MENLSLQDILNRINYYAKQNKLSGYKISLQLGHSKAYYSRLQKQKVNLSMETFLEVLEILGLKTSQFFTPLIDEESLKLLEKINSLSPDKRKTIENLINQFN